MGKGGMRYGAGRPGHRAKAEHLQRVDLAVWHRGGYLRAGRSFSWSWNRGGEPAGSIGVVVHGGNALTLQYTVGGPDARRDGSQIVGLEYTPCGFGGSRPWFACPTCTRRAGVLYLRGGRFACRRCQRVAYASQSGNPIDATWRRQAKIERRLGDNWRRPKGMRHGTYRRLIDELVQLEDRREAELVIAFSRLKALDGLL